jgi:SPP1 family predicted phage head-tail adaptor
MTLRLPPLPGIILHDVGVQKPVRVSNGQGGWNTTFPVAFTVRGNVQPITLRQQRELQISATQMALITHKAYLPGGTDVLAEDRLSAHGTEFRVAAVMDAGGLGQYLVCELLEVA